uniref:Mortality factor 4 like 1 n=2 Tax=Monodelphis domestica TaxID=13616 RepID=A0A5F8GUR8_MONDO
MPRRGSRAALRVRWDMRVRTHCSPWRGRARDSSCCGACGRLANQAGGGAGRDAQLGGVQGGGGGGGSGGDYDGGRRRRSGRRRRRVVHKWRRSRTRSPNSRRVNVYCVFMDHSFMKQSWDEWVPESRVLKYVDTNLQKQRELQKANQEQYAEGKMRGAAPGKKTSGLQQKNVEALFQNRWITRCLETSAISMRKTKKNKQKTPGIGEGSSTSETPQPPRKKRARVDPTVESEETFMNRVEVKVKIPEELKPWLVDDWDLITRQKQLFYLPAKKNVDSILEDYASYKKSRGNTDNKEYAVNEVVAGIKEYFNVMLGTQLLYKFERPQYAEILADHPDAPMSQVYGAPHLLRLFVRIGAMLAYTPLDEKSLALLLNYLHDFLKYLAKNSSALFSASDYEVAPPEYHRKAV